MSDIFKIFVRYLSRGAYLFRQGCSLFLSFVSWFFEALYRVLVQGCIFIQTGVFIISVFCYLVLVQGCIFIQTGVLIIPVLCDKVFSNSIVHWLRSLVGMGTHSIGGDLLAPLAVLL